MLTSNCYIWTTSALKFPDLSNPESIIHLQRSKIWSTFDKGEDVTKKKSNKETRIPTQSTKYPDDQRPCISYPTTYPSPMSLDIGCPQPEHSPTRGVQGNVRKPERIPANQEAGIPLIGFFHFDKRCSGKSLILNSPFYFLN